MPSVAPLYEYQRYRCLRSEKNYFKDNELHLTENSLKYLKSLNESKRFLEFGFDTIRPLNYVGIVRTDDLTIQIFPKLFNDTRYQEHLPVVAGNLLKMLSYAVEVPITETDLANLDLAETDLFEIFIHIFAKKLLHTIRLSQNREYIKKSDELRVVKGRINFQKYNNPCRMHIIPCDFHEFSSDNLLNQTLKFTCYLMARSIHDFSTIRNLKAVIDILDQVTLKPVRVADIDKIHFSRLNQKFKPFIDICKIFLSDSTLTMQASEVESFSLLFPMEKLFEQFITAILQEDPYLLRWGITVKAQDPIGTMARDENDYQLFNLYPDIVLYSTKREAILDLKYKELDEDDRKLGVSQSDVYQMYAYTTKTQTSKCMLLYPDVICIKEKNLIMPVPIDGETEREISLYIRSIPLSYNMNDKNDWKLFKEKIREVISPLIPPSNEEGIAPRIAVVTI